MAEIPMTSVTLLKDLAEDPQHPRWGEFVARYRPMMEAYLHGRFPYLESDDIIQETLVVLVEKLPTYRYVPEETGHFRNYLTGILRHKALRLCARAKRKDEVAADIRAQPPLDDAERLREEAVWREAVYEIALEQVLADASVQSRTRQVFVRTAVNGENPEDVARSFGITRNAVDQMKSRMISRMQEIVAQLEDVDVGAV